MRRLLLFYLTGLLVAAPLRAETVVSKISWAGLKEQGWKSSPNVSIEQDAERGSVLRIERSKETRTSIALLPPHGVSAPGYALRGDVRYQNVSGQAYLEMISRFPGEVRYFSRTLADEGPLQGIEGSSGWRAMVLPFMLQEGDEGPEELEIALILPAAGTVYLSDLELVQLAEGEDPLFPFAETRQNNDQSAARQGALVGTIVGVTVGLIGALLGVLAGVFAPRGKAKGFVSVCFSGAAILGLILLIAGVVALVMGHPYEVSYPLLTGGVGLLLISLSAKRTVLARYAQAELRKMGSKDKVC